METGKNPSPTHHWHFLYPSLAVLGEVFGKVYTDPIQGETC
jgi:hypothetical protein